MANKDAINKPKAKKRSSEKATVVNKSSFESKAGVSTSGKVILLKTKKSGVENTVAAENSKSRVPNATTRRALADLKAGRLTRYVDEDDLFKKLGIKVGKT